MPRRAPARAPLAPRTLVAVTLGALLTATLESTSAGAIVTVQGSATATAGWSDNIFYAPDEPTTTSAPHVSDFLFQLAPRLALSSGAPRILQRLSYSFTANLFATHSEANSYSNTLEWNASILTSPTTTLVLTLTSLQGKVSTLSFNQASSGATVTVLPQSSNLNYFSQSANEALEALPRANWRVSQLLRFSAFVPIDRGRLADSYDVVGEVGFDRVFRADAIGLVLREDVIDFVAPRDPVTDVAPPDTRQAMTSLVARWRRDWSPLWSTEAALGAIVAIGNSSDPTVGTRAAWEPSALAAVRWSKDIGAAELRYSHDVVPNPLVGSTFSRDSVGLQGGFPVIRAKMFFAATVAYQHARILPLVAGVAEASADVTVADVTIGWQPIPELGLFARYAFMHQFGAAPVTVDTPPPLANLTRQTVMLGLNFIYPAVSKVRVPTRQGTRVDRADQPDFPEVHAPQPR